MVHLDVVQAPFGATTPLSAQAVFTLLAGSSALWVDEIGRQLSGPARTRLPRPAIESGPATVAPVPDPPPSHDRAHVCPSRPPAGLAPRTSDQPLTWNTARRPRSRYKVTPSAKLAIAQRRLVSDRLWDRAMAAQFPRPEA